MMLIAVETGMAEKYRLKITLIFHSNRFQQIYNAKDLPN